MNAWTHPSLVNILLITLVLTQVSESTNRGYLKYLKWKPQTHSCSMFDHLFTSCCLHKCLVAMAIRQWLSLVWLYTVMLMLELFRWLSACMRGWSQEILTQTFREGDKHNKQINKPNFTFTSSCYFFGETRNYTTGSIMLVEGMRQLCKRKIDTLFFSSQSMRQQACKGTMTDDWCS